MRAAEKLRALVVEMDRHGGASPNHKAAFYAHIRYLDALPQILAVVETSICRRFTTSPCLTRPEIDPADYCASCAALAALDAVLTK